MALSLRPGDSVEHFVIVSPLGEGGMGQVYVARDSKLQRMVALKIMQPDVEGQASGPGSHGATRLIREAQAAAGLEHPNVVTIFEVGEISGEGEDAGRPFIAMELVKGRALRSFVGVADVPIKERVRWLVDIARALGAAHAAGLVHRDMKPENVMIRADGVVKVLDFGLAKRAPAKAASSSSTEAQVLPSLTGKGVAIGTPYYMAPEQMRRETLDGRADQFAWGVVAYELLSGEPPWGRDIDALELVSKLLSDEPAPLAQVCPQAPSNVVAAVVRSMAKRRELRFESMEALVAALEDTGGAFAPTLPRIEASQPLLPDAPSGPLVVAPQPPVPEAGLRTTTSRRAPPPPKRPRWIPIGAAGLGIGAALVVTLSLSRRSPPASAVATPGQSASVATVASRECARSSECVAKLGGKAATCHRGGRCVAIDSEECHALVEPGDLANDHTIWFGTMFPQSGDDATVGAQNEAGTELAWRELVAQTHGLPARDGIGPGRPIALVACDDSRSAGRVARHLVDDVGVASIIGFASTQEILDLAPHLLESRTVSFAVMNASPLLAKIPQPPEGRFLWRTLFTASSGAAATGALVPQLVEPRVRARAGRAGPIRVALLAQDTVMGTSLADELMASLRFNGKSAVENEHDFAEILWPPQGGAADARVLDRLRTFGPDVIILNAVQDLIVTRFVAPYEEQRDRARPPTYLVPDVLGGDALAALLARHPDVRARLFGMYGPLDTSTQKEFTLHYNERAETPLSNAESPSTPYDAFYVLAYASYLAILGGDEVTGATIARAIPDLLHGARVDVGRAHVLEAFAALRAARAIDLNGAATSLDFDPATGDVVSDVILSCMRPVPRSTGYEPREIPVRYSSRDRRWSGALACP